jgi:hypothetical protein
MSEPVANPSSSAPPDALVLQLLFSKMVFFSLSAVARLGIADHVTGTARDIEDIARDSATHTDSLYRVLRMLVSFGIFAEGPDRHFSLNPAAELLQSGHPRSLRDMAIMFADPWQLRSYARMDECLRTGTDGVTLEFGKHAFELFHDIPDEAANFHRAMTSISGMAIAPVLNVADFSGFRRLADCGGGHGLLLSRILAKFNGLHGVLYDLPEVVAGAPDAGHFHDVAGRATFEGGSFFERVPEGCDAYLMKHIVHDWDDESCRRILSLMREQLVKTAPETGRVFVVEMVVPDGHEPAPAKMLDIEMLVCTRGGRERTASEFARLFASAGLSLVGIVPTHSPVCLLEASLAK